MYALQACFANKRTDKLTGLLKKDIISIATMMGNKKIGTPEGANIFKNPIPFLQSNYGYSKKYYNCKKNVMIIWLVTVKAYGNRPIIFKVK